MHDDSLASLAAVALFDEDVGTDVELLAAVDEVGRGAGEHLSGCRARAHQHGDETRSGGCHVVNYCD